MHAFSILERSAIDEKMHTFSLFDQEPLFLFFSTLHDSFNCHQRAKHGPHEWCHLLNVYRQLINSSIGESGQLTQATCTDIEKKLLFYW